MQGGILFGKDWETLKETINVINDKFPTEKLRLAEIGIATGGTSNSIMNLLNIKKRDFKYFGIDTTDFATPQANLICFHDASPPMQNVKQVPHKFHNYERTPVQVKKAIEELNQLELKIKIHKEAPKNQKGGVFVFEKL